MREIKFRAWDKESKKMWYPSAITADGRNIALVNEFGIEREDLQKDIIMQYTGLKDKNRKEIYEGDLVNIDDEEKDNPFEIYFYAGFYRAKGKSTNLPTDRFNQDYYSNVEVVGNIYENPKLIKRL